MGLFNTLKTGASGLMASGAGLAVIGDNIANMNTTGFKRGRLTFADALPQGIGTLGGSGTVGNGVMANTVGMEFGQGMLTGTGSALDVAINGPGWFAVNDGGEQYYTRDGSFGTDNDGYLVNGGGLRVQGYTASNGQLSPVMGDIHIDKSAVPQKETTTVTLDAVLSTDDFDGTVDYATQILDGATETLANASSLADFSTSITVYDSLGGAHDVVLNFEQTGADPTGTQWNWSALIDAGETDVATGPNGENALEIASGNLQFDTDGELLSVTDTPGGTAWTWPGTSAFAFDLEVGLDSAGVANGGSIRATGVPSSVQSIQQDGSSVGDLVQLSVGADGVIRGQYTNGESRDLGALAIATFSSENGLQKAGANLMRATHMSGQPAIGQAGTGSRGTTTGYALERSNVDLEQEFVEMIQVQRAYSANAGVVRTADETLQELVNLV